MDLINEYLRAVAALLPRAQREDITAELRDIILSRIEAREAALGHRLTDDEIEAELRAVGHPILVAARYRGEPQHLVGPSLYPYWIFGVKIAIAIEAAAILVMLTLRILSGQDFGNALGQAIGQGVTGLVTLIGVATVAAWLIERRKIHVSYLDHWRVRDLRVLEYAGWDFADLCAHFRPGKTSDAVASDEMRLRHPRSPVGHAIFLIACGTVFILWWVGVLHLDILDPATDPHRLGIDLGALAGTNFVELHRLVFWPVLLYGAAIIVQGALILGYPAAIWLRGLFDILMGAAMLAFCIWIWTASPIVSAIRVDSLAQLMLKLKLDFQNGPPLSVTPFLTLLVGGAAFGAVINIVKGLWEMMTLSRQAN